MTCRLNYNWAHDFPKLAREAGFCFSEPSPSGPIDWSALGSIDVDRIYRQRDFSSLESSMHHVLDGPLCGLLEARILDPSISKLFKIAQLSIQYLLFCKQLLDRSVTVLKNNLDEANEEIRLLKKQAKIKDDTIFKYRKKSSRHVYSEHYMNPMTAVSAPAACNICGKTFMNLEFLNGHLTRRHGNLQTECDMEPSRDGQIFKPYSTTTTMKDNQLIETVKMQLEIRQLKERLSSAEMILSSENIRAKQSSTDASIPPEKNEIIETCDKETSTDSILVGNVTITPKVPIQMIKPVSLTSKDSSTNTDFQKEAPVKQTEEVDTYRKEITELKEKLDKNLEAIKHERIWVEVSKKMAECENIWMKRSEELESRLESDRRALKKTTDDIMTYKKQIEMKELELNKKLEQIEKRSEKKVTIPLPELDNVAKIHENIILEKKKKKSKHVTKVTKRKRSSDEENETPVKKMESIFANSIDLAESYQEYQKSAGILEIVKSVKDTTIPMKPEKLYPKTESLNVDTLSETSSSSRNKIVSKPKSITVEKKPSNFFLESESIEENKDLSKMTVDFVSKFTSASESTETSEKAPQEIAPKSSKPIIISPAKTIHFEQKPSERTIRREALKRQNIRSGEGDSINESIKYFTPDDVNDEDVEREKDKNSVKLAPKPKTSRSSLQLRSVRSLRQALVDNPEEFAAYRNFMVEDLKNKLWSLNIDPSTQNLLEANFTKTMKTLLHERNLTQKKFAIRGENFLEIHKNLEKQLNQEVNNHLKTKTDEIITIVEPKPRVQRKRFTDSAQILPAVQEDCVNESVKNQQAKQTTKPSIFKTAISTFKAKSFEILPKSLSPKNYQRRPASQVLKRKDTAVIPEMDETHRTIRSELLQQVQRQKGISNEYKIGIPSGSDSIINSDYSDDESVIEFTGIDLSRRKLSTSVERLLESPINKPEPYEIKAFHHPISSSLISPTSGTNTQSMYTEATSESEQTDEKGNILVGRTNDKTPEELVRPTSPEPYRKFRDFGDKPNEETRDQNELILNSDGLNKNAIIVGKKKVIFDLEANTQKTLSSIVQSPQNLDEHSDFEIPSIEDLPPDNIVQFKSTDQHYENIVLSTKQSPKIAEISSIIQTQMKLTRHKPVGGIETEFMTENSKLNKPKTIYKNSNTESSTSLNSSILDGSKILSPSQKQEKYEARQEIKTTQRLQPVPRPRTFSYNSKPVFSDSKNVLDDLELSDFSF